MDLQLITSLQHLCHWSVLNTWYLQTPREAKKCGLFCYKNFQNYMILIKWRSYQWILSQDVSQILCVCVSTFRSSSKLIIQHEKSKDRNERNSVPWTRTWVCNPRTHKKQWMFWHILTIPELGKWRQEAPSSRAYWPARLSLIAKFRANERLCFKEWPYCRWYLRLSFSFHMSMNLLTTTPPHPHKNILKHFEYCCSRTLHDMIPGKFYWLRKSLCLPMSNKTIICTDCTEHPINVGNTIVNYSRGR